MAADDVNLKDRTGLNPEVGAVCDALIASAEGSGVVDAETRLKAVILLKTMDGRLAMAHTSIDAVIHYIEHFRTPAGAEIVRMLKATPGYVP